MKCLERTVAGRERASIRARGWGLLVASLLGALVARGSAEPPRLPAATRAALIVQPQRLAAQPAASQALALPWVLRAFATYPRVGVTAERFSVLVLGSDGGRETLGLSARSAGMAEAFAAVRGKPAGPIAGQATYRLANSPDLVALLAGGEIAEGSALALRLALAPETAAAAAKRGLERSLLGASEARATATLVHLGAPEGANLVAILADLDAIWPGLARLAAPYETPLKLLGEMRGGRADVWQDADSVRVRVVLVSTGSGQAKRSQMALRTARQLAPLMSDAAVRAGTLTPQDAAVVTRILGAMRSRTDEEQLSVDLAIAASDLVARP